MIYFQYLKILLKSHLQYRASLLMLTLGQFFVTFFSFVALLLMFDRFGALLGWTLGEVALCYAVANLSFSLSECVARGFDTFQLIVRSGDFDRVLLRPRSTIVQVLGSSFELSRAGKIVQGAIALGLAIRWIDVAWTWDRIAVLCLMILSGAVIFSGVFILGACVCFWTVQGLEGVNIFTDGGREVTGYPLSIFGKGFLRFFTFVLPYATFNVIPLGYLTGRAGGASMWSALSPLFGMLFLIPCLLAWRAGVRRYESTGS